MSTFYVSKAKLFIGNDNGDEFTPLEDFAPGALWPADEITISGTIESADDRRNLLVWWIMLDALAAASRILD